jgi:hypothetical protein
MPFIIDGCNLLWAIEKTGDRREKMTDVALCHAIGHYLKLVGQQGEVIFDGTGPRDKGRFDNISNLEVYFAGLGTDADTVIEDKIKADNAPKGLTIVSSDHRIRDAARRRRSCSVTSLVFWNDLQEQLRSNAMAQEPEAKRLGLTESETEEWLRFFGIE